MVAILDQALGHGTQPLSPRLPLPDYWKEQGFAEPIATEEVIRATLKSLAAALADVLEQRGEGARRLEAVFFRADGAVRRIAIEMGVPTREPAIIERLFREKLDTLADPLDPGFGFDLIRLSASRVERATCEVADFDASINEKADISFLVDRLATRFGSQRILAFQPNDTHIPEAAWAAVPAQYVQPSKLPWKKIRERWGCAAPSAAPLHQARTCNPSGNSIRLATSALAKSAACRDAVRRAGAHRHGMVAS